MKLLSSVIKISDPARRSAPSRAVFSEFVGLAPEHEELVEMKPAAAELIAEMIASARRQAAEIVAAAKLEAARIEREAEQEGRARGMALADESWQDAFARLDESAQAMQNERDEFFHTMESEIVSLSMEIVRKLIPDELSLRPDAVLAVVREALKRVTGREVRILVHPLDLDRVRGGREGLCSIVPGIEETAIVADPRVGEGGCIVETPSGYIDAQLDRQLLAIEESLAGALEV